MDTPNTTRASGPRPSMDLVADVVTHGLQEPLAALRATLDAFARKHAGGEQAELASAALDQVVGLSRTTQILAELANPPAIHPMRCTVEEIVRGALGELDADVRPRVLLALEDRRHRLLVDGPLVSRCLAHLVRDGLRGNGECMLHVRRNGERAQFVIVHATSARTRGPESTLPLGLERHIAQRDIGRMGGSVAFSHADATATCIVDGFTEADSHEVAA